MTQPSSSPQSPQLPPRPTILVVDDEPAVVDLLVYNLRKANYAVLTAADGDQALQVALSSAPDLIVLDLMLPGKDGFEVCRELRKTSNVPIIMLTAQGDEVDRVVGLELGADDYVCKPFSPRELVARIKAVLRRGCDPPGAAGPIPTEAKDQVVRGPSGLELNIDRRAASIAGSVLDLTRLEFDLLLLLITEIERVFTREQLLQQVWGYDFPGDPRAVDSAVKRLRGKLRDAAPDADRIVAVRGIGYKFSRLEAA